MFCSIFLGRTWDFPCLFLLEHDSTTNPSVILTRLLPERWPQVPLSSINIREKCSWFLFVWGVTQAGATWGPGGQVGMDQPCALAAGTARSLLGCVNWGTASRLREGVICLFSALRLDTASSFGPPSGRRHIWTAVSSAELQEADQGWSICPVEHEKMGSWGCSAWKKDDFKGTSQKSSPPHT